MMMKDLSDDDAGLEMFLDRIQYLIFLTERLRKTMADYSAYF
jgi:hypothetical protein